MMLFLTDPKCLYAINDTMNAFMERFYYDDDLLHKV